MAKIDEAAAANTATTFNKSIPKMPYVRQLPPLTKMDDCDRPACDDVVDHLTAAMGRIQHQNQVKQNIHKVQCPPNSSLLGKNSWNLLHSMAAWYPENPTTEEQSMMVNFVSSLARFYPCTWCASDFQENLKVKPVQATSRENLCIWLCGQHNLVNEKLGKKLFPCDMTRLDERWRKSSNPECNNNHL
mmetsp:Transcript_7972/g.8816  ORF Transcript_7972/g.8816 Transcript_7972/m.8816 type:complete len:188 (+) Transcript_7972:54-617(+)